MLPAAEVRRLIEAAPREGLDTIGKVLWQGVADGQISETEAESLDVLLQARKVVPAVQAPPRRPVGSRPRSDASMGRRRRWAASGWLPARLAAHFTTAEAAVLATIAHQVRKFGRCTLAVGSIASLAGVSASTVRRALKHARLLGLVTIEERRISRWRSDTNIIEVVSAEWMAWLQARGGGFQLGQRTNTKVHLYRNSDLNQTGSRVSGRRKRRLEGQHREPPEHRAVGS